MTSLVAKLVSDELWEIIAPLLPPPPRSPRGGRPRRVQDRYCLAGIIYMTRASMRTWSAVFICALLRYRGGVSAASSLEDAGSRQ